jgi:hypothetical protein
MSNNLKYYFLEFNYKHNLGNFNGAMTLTHNDLPNDEEIKNAIYEKYKNEHENIHNITVLSIQKLKDKKEYEDYEECWAD